MTNEHTKTLMKMSGLVQLVAMSYIMKSVLNSIQGITDEEEKYSEHYLNDVRNRK